MESKCINCRQKDPTSFKNKHLYFHINLCWSQRFSRTYFRFRGSDKRNLYFQGQLQWVISILGVLTAIWESLKSFIFLFSYSIGFLLLVPKNFVDISSYCIYSRINFQPQHFILPHRNQNFTNSFYWIVYWYLSAQEST